MVKPIMPTNRDISGDPFKRGAQVEVNLDDDGFRGSWYTATVVRRSAKSHKKKPRLHLQFHTLTAAGRGGVTEPLREAVDLILCRPIPPREQSPCRFLVGEDVDAFHNDGWWEGIVISVLDGGDRYSIFFRSSREQLVFAAPDLRRHREWVYGKWVPPLEEDEQLPPQPNQTN